MCTTNAPGGMNVPSQLTPQPNAFDTQQFPQFNDPDAKVAQENTAVTRSIKVANSGWNKGGTFASAASSVTISAGVGVAPIEVQAASSASSSFRANGYKNGIITACNHSTYGEVMRRRLIGLPRGQADLVNQLCDKTSAIFLLNMESKEMFGVFEADGSPGLNLDPDAWTVADNIPSRSSSKNSINRKHTSRFPAQCRFTIAADFESPLYEHQYRDLLFKVKREKIRILSSDETRRLIQLFQTKSPLRRLVTQSTITTTATSISSDSVATVDHPVTVPSDASNRIPNVTMSGHIRVIDVAALHTEEQKHEEKENEEEECHPGEALKVVSHGRKRILPIHRTCSRWLHDECTLSDDTCAFLHFATICQAFQRGVCPKQFCPFVHDKVDRDHYRHGRSCCPKTAVHPDQKNEQDHEDDIEKDEDQVLSELEADAAAAVDAELMELQQQRLNQEEDMEFAWFSNFRQNIINPALEAFHARKHTIIGPD